MASTPKQKRKMEFWTLGGCDQSQSFESPQSLNLKVNSTEPVVAKGGEEPWFSQNKRNWKKFLLSEKNINFSLTEGVCPYSKLLITVSLVKVTASI